MQPVYVSKADPRQRTTWMDWFIAQEPKGGVRDVVAMAHQDPARTVFARIFAAGSAADRVAA